MKSIVLEANKLGKAACDGFWEEHNKIPSFVEDEQWIDAAWSLHWKELVDEGAKETDRDSCRAAWCVGITGATLPPRQGKEQLK